MEDQQSQGEENPADDKSNRGLGCIVVLAHYHGVPVETAQVTHLYGTGRTPLDAMGLVRALRELGFKARRVATSWEQLGRLALPAILEAKDGDYCILAKVTETEALLQYPAEGRSRKFTRADVEAFWTGGLILVTRQGGLQTDGRFGFRWFSGAVKKYRALMGEVLLASAFVQFFALLTPLVFMVVIDKVLSHNSLSTLDVLVFALAVVAVFEVLLNGLRSYLLSHTTNRIDVELGVRLFRHLLALPLSYFESRRVGDTVARMRELEGVRRFITGSALTLVLDLVFTVIFLAVMFAFSPLLAGIVIAVLPLFFVVSFAMTPLLRGKLDDRFGLGAENQSFLVETVTGIETLKSVAAEPHVQRAWEERLADYVKASFHSGHLASVTSQTISFIGKGLILLLLWVGARLVLKGELTVGQLIAFNMLAARVNAPILRIAQIWQDFQQMRISMRRLADILDAPAEPIFRRSRGGLPDLKGEVRCEHVTFRYRPDGPEVLSDVSLDIRPGKVVGIVGASGSGKTTLAKLLQRLYVPERGRILIDGVDLASVDASWLRRQIGVVAQDSVLFNRSVRDNIAFANPTLSIEHVQHAAQLAGAHEFILELPDGYDTELGERGRTLSAGQRQRIAIARALVTNPRLLILDEATNSLDFESERLIQQNMRKICEGRTVFVITHRLSAVREADRVITIERGRVVEDDKPEILLANGGRYAELHRIQAGIQGSIGEENHAVA